APFVRDGVFDHGRATAPRNTGAAHVAFGCVNGLGLCDFVLSRLNSPPHTIAVYASSRTSPTATQHSLPSRRYPLLGRDLHPLDHISFPDALTLYSTQVRDTAGAPRAHDIFLRQSFLRSIFVPTPERRTTRCPRPQKPLPLRCRATARSR